MNLRNVGIVYRKELKDMLRDRRTIFAMFLFPMILFPLMTVGIGQLMEGAVKRVKKEPLRIMLLGAENAPQLAERIRTTEGIEVLPPAGDYAQQVAQKKLRVAVEFPSGFEQDLQHADAKPTIKLYYYMAEIRSESAADRVEELIHKYRDTVVESRLAAKGLPATILVPVKASPENVAAPEKVAGSRFGMMIPYFIIILTMMGAMHPAMDLTAGEKERGTLETILVCAVGRSELVLGKFLLVLTTSLTTTITSLVSYSGTMILASSFAKDYIQEITRGQQYSISLKAVGAIFLLALPLAVFFSGALVAVSLFAKNYKEAQSYGGYMMMGAIFPALFGMIPGIELSPMLALIPVVNVSLVAREIFTGSFPTLFYTLTFVSTCAAAAIGLYAAVSLFQREDVLFRT